MDTEEKLRTLERFVEDINKDIIDLHKNGCAERLKKRTENPNEIDKIMMKYCTEEELLLGDKEAIAEIIRDLLKLRREYILQYKWLSGTYGLSKFRGVDDDDIIRAISNGNGDQYGYGD